ncbi:MAG TPA: O-acetyl-ADP-ribose deacetylase [Herpetosiphonaceae bacterium]
MIGSTRLELVRGDIARQEVDAIVNAANRSLLGGGGVDGAIHHVAGPELLAACRELGGCATGEAKLTPGFGLPARFVIHAVGPVYRGRGDEAEPLAAAYRSALELAAAHGARSIAFPAISAGAYAYPLPDAARVALETVIGWIRQNQRLELARFVLWDGAALDAFRRALKPLIERASGDAQP